MVYTLKNRSTREAFSGIYDGETYTVAPNGTLTVLDYVALHLHRQSILRDNPIDPRVNEYQLAIVEKGHDQTPYDQDRPAETLDRSDMDLPHSKIIYTKTREAAPVKRDQVSQVGTGERR